MHPRQLQPSCLWAGLLLLLLIAHVQAHTSQHRRHRHPPRLPHETHERDLQVNLEWSYKGFQLFDFSVIFRFDLPDSCKVALQQPIHCHSAVISWKSPGYHTSLFNRRLTDYVCDSTCGRSLQDYYNQVHDACAGNELHGAIPTLRAGRLWAGFNETCLRTEDGKDYCNDIIAAFNHPHDYKKMSHDELCSFCYVERVSMMQRTPFSIFDQRYKRRLEYIQEKCGLSCSTDIPPSPEPPQPPKPDPFCLSDKIIKTARPETCDSIAEEHKLSSAALYITNQPAIVDCYNIPAGVKLCLPPSCKDIYVLRPEDTGRSIEENHYDQSRGIAFGSLLRTYNPWVSPDYSNLRNGSTIYGCVLCLGPPNGFHTKAAPLHGNPAISTSRLGQAWTYETPPEDCEVAEATTQECGKWHKAQQGDSCAQLAMSNIITSKLLLAANPSLGKSARECEDRITVGKAYCVRPTFGWDYPYIDIDESPRPGNHSSSTTNSTKSN